MSIVSMTEVAFQSRTDVGSPGYYPKTYSQIAGAAGGNPEAESPVNAAMRMLTTYIPTETLTLYVAILAALQPFQTATEVSSRWTVFYSFLIATPIIIWLVYMVKVRIAGKSIPGSPLKWPLWEMVAGTIAYVAWAFALPATPFSKLTWYSAGIAGIVVLVASTILGLVAPLFARPIKP